MWQLPARWWQALRTFDPDRVDPLRVAFVLTFMPVGGAETLLVNLVRRLDRRRFAPEICCLKYLGPLGEELAAEVPAYSGLLRHKYDLPVLPRLISLFRQRRYDAVITVGTGGDKMFWGRLAAWRAGVPVIGSALHSTGLPDRVEPSNRQLACLTDAFIAVAPAHGRYIAEHEGCPAAKVRVIPNGVDVERFRPRLPNAALRAELGLPPHAPVAAIVAALRPEKNHELFLRVAARVVQTLPTAKFLVVGDGPRRAELEQLAQHLGLADAVQFLGTRGDVHELLSVVDVAVLTSHMEANPVSLLEALASETPVLAPRVGSIPDVVEHGAWGLLAPAHDENAFSEHLVDLLAHPARAQAMGAAGRRRVLAEYSLEAMVAGYQNLLLDTYQKKVGHLPDAWRATVPANSNANCACADDDAATHSAAPPPTTPAPTAAPTAMINAGAPLHPVCGATGFASVWSPPR